MRRAPAATRGTARACDHGRVNSLKRAGQRMITARHLEDPMIKCRAHRLGVLVAAVLFSVAVSLGPVLAAGDPEPRSSEPKSSGPKGSGTKGSKQKSGQKKKKNQGTELQQQFIDGYRAARALVLEGKYEEG